MHKRISQCNEFVKKRFVHLMTLTVLLGVVFPKASLGMKDAVLFHLPGTSWALELPMFALICMMLSASTQCRLQHFLLLAKSPGAFLLGIALIYLILPLLGWAAAQSGSMLLGPAIGPQVGAGIVLVVLMPVAMTSNLWVRLVEGNIPLLLSFITLSTALSILVTPLYLSLILNLSRSQIHVPTGHLARQLLVAVIFPLITGMLLREFMEERIARWQPVFSLAGNVGLHLAIFSNVGVAIPSLKNLSLPTLAVVVGMTAMLNFFNYAVSYFCGKSLKLSHEDKITVSFAGGMRSNGTALVVGLKSFPAYPLVTVPAAIYIIVQHLIAGRFAKFIENRRQSARTAASNFSSRSSSSFW